jgi:hypothetical protein
MATAAAAMLAIARREVEKLFFENDAFSPDRAVEFQPRIPVQSRFLNQMIAQGFVHETESGRYWLDLHAYERARRERAIWTWRVLGFAAVILVLVSAATYFGLVHLR